MSEQGPLTRQPSHGAAPSLAELLDPVALEERLRAARARRALVLAKRPSQAGDLTPATTVVPSGSQPRRSGSVPPEPVAADPPGADPPAPLHLRAHSAPPGRAVAATAPPREPRDALPLAAPMRRTARGPRVRFGRKVLFAMFSAGCGLGAVAAVLALGAFDLRGGTGAAERRTLAPDPAQTAALRPEPASPAALVEAPQPVPAAFDAPPPELPEPRVAVEAGLPETLDPPSADAPPPESAAAPAPAGRAAVPAAGPPVLDPEAVRVLIHLPSSLTDETVAGAVAALEGAGLDTVALVPIDIPIGRTNLRYYHAEDRAAAEQIAAMLGGTLPGGPPVVRDFTYFQPPPRSGRIEVWVAGQPAPGSEARAPAPVSSLADAVAPGVTAQIERLLLELGGR